MLAVGDGGREGEVPRIEYRTVRSPILPIPPRINMLSDDDANDDDYDRGC